MTMTPSQIQDNINDKLSWLQGFLTGIRTEESENGINEALSCSYKIRGLVGDLILSTIKIEVTKTGTSNCSDVGEPMPKGYRPIPVPSCGDCCECGNPIYRVGNVFCDECIANENRH